MKAFGLIIVIAGGLISLSGTRPYLPDGLLFMVSLPFFPAFSIYAWVSDGFWQPTAWFVGSYITGTILMNLDNEDKGDSHK